jgi:dTDP-4-dehydrorhamnose 3,5-epimerase
MVSSETGAARLPPGVRVRDLPQRDDDRGFLVELTSATLGDDAKPAQWNVLRSTANTLRGMHVHVRHTDWITVVAGEAVLGLVDLRAGSIDDALRATVPMHSSSLQVLTIPPGVLHGIYTPESSVILNGLSHEFDSADDLAARYDDPSLGLEWNVRDPVLSPRDRGAPAVADLLDRLAAEGVGWPARNE